MSSATAPNLIAVHDVNVRFGGVHAVKDVSLEVPAGAVYGLIGSNGAGKTTLFDAITGLNKLASGTIMFDGADVTARSATWRARAGVRRTFQRQQMVGSLTIEENVLCGMEWRGGGGGLLADMVGAPSRRTRERERRERAREMLAQCGLESLRSTRAASLPIGQARLVELARALVDRPALLLLDEPTSGMTTAGMETLREVLRRQQSETDMTVLVVEHDVGFIMDLSDRVLVMHLGALIAEGSPEEIRTNDLVRSTYLGTADVASS